MKKILFLLCFLFLIPSIDALSYGIEEYKFDITLQDDGDLHVIEQFELNGSFKGFERTVLYENTNLSQFNGTLESLEGSSIYNASDIEVLSVKIGNNMDNYKTAENVNYASDGDSYKYIVYDTQSGYDIKIYNPSSNNTNTFYIEYLIKDVAIKHTDYGEVGYNIFSDIQNEDIRELVINFNLEEDSELLRAWAHGPLHGDIVIVDQKNVQFVIEDLHSNVPLDIRLLFDKTLIPNATKSTDLNVLDHIIEIETELANEANEIREELREKEKQVQIISQILDVVRVFIIVGIIYKVIELYKEHDKEYESTFKTKYYRDMPGTYNPSAVGYLLNKRIGTNEMSAVIMDLVQRKIITFREENKKQLVFRNEFKEGESVVTDSEKYLIEFLFNDIGNGETFTMKELNKYAKKEYSTFLSRYNDWVHDATDEAKEFKFYEDKSNVKKKYILIMVLIFFINIFTIAYTYYGASIVLLIVSVITLIYLITFNKRSVKGNDDYKKWIGLKNFLKDFGRFKDKELPEIALWEKFLVYSVVFGISKKLAKQMEIKFNQMNTNTNYNNLMFNSMYFHSLSNMNNQISSSVTRAVSTAKQISHSNNSSGGGFGGGFSGGGGGFGGGGGGGRF